MAKDIPLRVEPRAALALLRNIQTVVVRVEPRLVVVIPRLIFRVEEDRVGDGLIANRHALRAVAAEALNEVSSQPTRHFFFYFFYFCV